MVSNPMVNLHLQGRFDGYPKRRGLTQVKELLAAGVNVAFGHDDVMDPWYPLGTANPLQVAHVGTHATQLSSRDEIAESFRMVTSRAAAVLGLGRRVRRRARRPASFLLLPAGRRFDAVRRQVRPPTSSRTAGSWPRTPAAVTTLSWPGRPAQPVDFVSAWDAAPAAATPPA